jgi:lysyl-tRNA synthetase class I
MAVSERRELESLLVRLIWHIIKWYTQPWARSKSWFNSIQDSRNQIDRLLAKHPTLRNLVDRLIPKAFKEAKKGAEEEMHIKTTITELSRKQLFEDEYKLEE